jgi:hypothetical protein
LSLRNAYEAIRFSMARSLETETWFAVVMIRPFLGGHKALSSPKLRRGD